MPAWFSIIERSCRVPWDGTIVSHINPPVRADHVGSLLRPKILLEARQPFDLRVIRSPKKKSISHRRAYLSPVNSARWRIFRKPISSFVDRIKEAGRYMPLDQMCLSPQCGFASTYGSRSSTQGRTGISVCPRTPAPRPCPRRPERQSKGEPRSARAPPLPLDARARHVGDDATAPRSPLMEPCSVGTPECARSLFARLP